MTSSYFIMRAYTVEQAHASSSFELAQAPVQHGSGLFVGASSGRSFTSAATASHPLRPCLHISQCAAKDTYAGNPSSSRAKLQRVEKGCGQGGPFEGPHEARHSVGDAAFAKTQPAAMGSCNSYRHPRSTPGQGRSQSRCALTQQHLLRCARQCAFAAYSYLTDPLGGSLQKNPAGGPTW